MNFLLCDECRASYSSLTFDETCCYTSNVAPFGSLVWLDEHPSPWDEVICDDCQQTVRRLVHLRTAQWRGETIESEFQSFWAQAKTAIPGWPGFRRLSLNAEQEAALEKCDREVDDMIADMREKFPSFRVINQLGDMSFTATPAKPWWQFWR